MKVLLLGCGYWGKNYLRILSEMHTIVEEMLIYDKDEKKTEIFDWTGHKDSFDCAIVATPSSTHYSIAHKLLSLGKHVLVEKPMCLTGKEADSLNELASKNNCILMTGNTYLYHPAIHYIKCILGKGELGKIFYVNMKRVHLGLVREDVNVIWDLMPHDISILLYLFGIDSINQIKKNIFCNTDKVDAAFVSFKKKNGIVVNISVSWCDAEKERKIEIVGSKGKIIFNDLDIQRPVTIIKKDNESSRMLNNCNSHADHLTKTIYGDIIQPRIEYKEPLKELVNNFLKTCDILPSHSGETVFKDDIGTKTVKILEQIDSCQ